jgi:hypothetical protein
MDREPYFWYNFFVRPRRWAGGIIPVSGNAMNAELRRRSEEVLNRLTRLRDSL